VNDSEERDPAESGTAVPPRPEKLEWRTAAVPGVTVGGTWVVWGLIEDLLEYPAEAWSAGGTPDAVRVPGDVRRALTGAGLAHETGNGGLRPSAALGGWAASLAMTPEPAGDGMPDPARRLERDIAVLREAEAALDRAFHPSVNPKAATDPVIAEAVMRAKLTVRLAAVHQDRRLRKADGPGSGPFLRVPVPGEAL
jgi:hypothetical protein